jgi:hypothetical protein
MEFNKWTIERGGDWPENPPHAHGGRISELQIVICLRRDTERRGHAGEPLCSTTAFPPQEEAEAQKDREALSPDSIEVAKTTKVDRSRSGQALRPGDGDAGNRRHAPHQSGGVHARTGRLATASSWPTSQTSGPNPGGKTGVAEASSEPGLAGEQASGDGGQARGGCGQVPGAMALT